jgi:CBS domain containing-hemolysin-like protein
MIPTTRLSDATSARPLSRPIIVGLLAGAWLLASSSPAHASLLSPEAEDTMAKYIAIFALTFVPVALIVVFWMVHVLPEKIAHQRHHPQLEAIKTLCLLSLVFGGLLWPIAWLWAYTKPVGYKLAYGTDKHPDYYKEHGLEPESQTADIRQRISALEEHGVPANELDAIRADLAALESRLAAGDRSEAR